MTSREYKYHLQQRRSKFKIVTADKALKAKKRCPYCGAALDINCTGWQFDERTMLWIATDIDIECMAMPDFENEDEWDDWFFTHTQDMYSIWFPLQKRFVEALQKKYRYTL